MNLSSLEWLIIIAHLALFFLFIYLVRSIVSEKPKALPKPPLEEVPPPELKPAQVEEKPVEAEPEPVAPAEKAKEIPEEKEAEPTPAEKAEEIAPPKEVEKSLEEGLEKTRAGFFAKLTSIFKKSEKLDQKTLEQIEEILYTADIGVRTADKLISFIREEMKKGAIDNPAMIIPALKEQIVEMLSVPVPELKFEAAKPFSIMVIGVNGVGKTTTIGKLSAQFRDMEKEVLLAAGDTFRAAAVEQLEIWAGRSGAQFARGKENADPSSVIFDALKQASSNGVDIVLADTAGRLHTKVPLMDELKKIRRVMGKAVDSAPNEIWLVLDATTGQNAIAQAKQFQEALENLSGIILTKLDGTAKGGVVVGICDQLKIPVRYIGIGEKVSDLRRFDPSAFASAIFAE